MGIQVLPVASDDLKSPKSPLDRKHSGFLDDSRSSTEDLDRKGRNKKRRRKEEKQVVVEKKSVSPTRGNWNMAGATQWEYPANLIITDLSELVYLDAFINRKVGGAATE